MTGTEWRQVFFHVLNLLELNYFNPCHLTFLAYSNFYNSTLKQFSSDECKLNALWKIKLHPSVLVILVSRSHCPERASASGVKAAAPRFGHSGAVFIYLWKHVFLHLIALLTKFFLKVFVTFRYQGTKMT